MGPDPAVADVRRCVRRCLSEFAAGDLLLVACSGGADSLALAAALAREAPRCGLRAGGITVDHGLQPGSVERAREVAAVLAGLGLDPVEAVTVTVAGGAGRGGPEAAARAARYRALAEAATRAGAAAVLLGHSRDDQAETVLLGLARGSGARSLAGMPAGRGPYRRPLLGLSRATLRAACEAAGLRPWDDPQNADLSFARAR
ncbi:MAG TPA: tRNA lysidine(34) synthetase TilS, partial [Streptosporangiaceae bacterium]